MALMLYFLARRETSAWSGLAAGLVFLHYNLYYEGLTANREWFSAPFLLAGAFLCAVWLRRPERGAWLMLAAGLLSSLALWFKLHAAFLILAIPALLLWRVIMDDGRRSGLRGLLAYAAGGAIGLGAYFGCFLVAGTFADYFGSVVTDWNVYTMGNVAAAGDAPAGPWVYLKRLYLHRSFRPLLLAAYAASAVALLLMAGRMLKRARPRNPLLENPVALLLALYTVLALITVSLGQRFFEHYFLYLIFPVAGMIGFALHALATSERGDRLLRYLAGAWILLFVADRVVMLRAYPPSAIAELWPGSVVVVLYVLLGVALLVWAALRLRKRTALAAAGLLVLEIGLLVVLGQARPAPSSTPHHPRGFDALVRYIQANAQAEDRIFVWGWLPEIYSLTRLESASHLTVCQYVVNDTLAEQTQPAIQGELSEMLMRDLRARQPRFIVDASRRSWTMLESGNPWIYDLRRYPEFELVEMLRTEYVPAGTFDGCAVYLRR
jgi:hypothetical protein